jgi:hypothetical protein
LDQGERRSVKIGKEFGQECCLSPVVFSTKRQYISEEVLERFGDFRIGGQVTRTLEYTVFLVILTTEEIVV